MGFSIPYRRGRRYLTGVDWIIGTLDCMTGQATGAGNASQIILELDGRLEEGLLRECVARFVSHFPVLSGYPSRDGMNLAPFWQMDRPCGNCRIERLAAQATTAEAVVQLCRALNTPFTSRREHLVFRLVHVGAERSLLGMAFDHKLFDARGAELFLDRFAAFSAGEANRDDTPSPSGDSSSPSPPHSSFPRELTRPARQPYLTCWADKFRAGRNVNRALHQCAAARPGQFALPAGRPPFRYQFQLLSEPENHAITENAYRLGGYLVKMPYLLALAAEAVDGIFSARGIAPESYVIPVSIDRRAARADNQELFFNHISFLHFIISRADLQSTSSLVQSLTRQMYEQTKARLPEDFENTMMLMRILPVGVLAAFSQRIFKGNMGSFAFSWLGESECRVRQLFGLRILNLIHTPRVSTPPGIGIFLNEFAGRMNVTAAYLEGIITEEEGGQIARYFQPKE